MPIFKVKPHYSGMTFISVSTMVATKLLSHLIMEQHGSINQTNDIFNMQEGAAKAQVNSYLNHIHLHEYFEFKAMG